MEEIIKKLVDSGYEAYVVGGYVRDFLLGNKSYDIDICTNAPINKIISLFQGRGKAFKQYFSYHIEENEYSYDITSFREEFAYKKNKPIDIRIANDLETDLKRRDFTINTFAIDKDNHLIDIYNAKEDLNNKIIKVVGDTQIKLSEDKTRIIRAIRFACTLDFDLDSQIIKFINKKGCLLNEVPREYIKKELDKIFDSSTLDKFMFLIRRYNLSKYLSISVSNLVNAYNRYGIWAQIETDLPFSKKEKNIISSIKEIIDSGSITVNQINKYDEVVMMNAAVILNQVDKYKALVELSKVRSVLDIDVPIYLVAMYVGYKDAKRVYKKIEKYIMEGKLENDSKKIESFLRSMHYE